MSTGLLDLVAAGYWTWGVWKGRRRGLSVELPRLAGVALALVTGAGLFHWTGHVLGQMSKLAGQTTGAFGWIGVVAAAYYLVRQFRARLGHWIAQRWPDDRLQKRAGMIAGFLRTLVISCLVAFFLLHTPLAFLVRASLIGRLLPPPH